MPRACETCGAWVGLYEPECTSCGTPNPSFRSSEASTEDVTHAADTVESTVGGVVGVPPPPPSPPTTPWYARPWARRAGTVVAVGVFVLFRAGVFDTPPEERLLNEAESQLRSAGVSSDSWACIEDRVRGDGSVDGLKSVTDAEWSTLPENVLMEGGLEEVPAPVAAFTVSFIDSMLRCLSITEMELAAASGSFLDPMTYGSDPMMDMLHDGCGAGSNADCDMLYAASPGGSSYEDYALTCGGRTERLDPVATSCIYELRGLSEIDSLVSQCENGFFVACDLLFSVTAIGSPEEEIAINCGERGEPPIRGACTLAYGYGSRP